MDILNAHLQFVTPFLKQHGVEYERDRFTEKLDVGEISLDMTHLWLHRAIRQLRTAAGVATPATPAGAAAEPPAPEVQFYRQLLSDLEQKRGDAYLKLLRVAIVDNLLGSIVCVERKVGSSAPPALATNPAGAASSASAAGGSAGGGPVAAAAAAAAAAAKVAAVERDDQQEDMLEGVAVPETLMLDRYRLVVIAAAAEQAAYTASLVAFARQTLGGARIPLAREDEERVRDALMVLFETEDVTSADICAQVKPMMTALAESTHRSRKKLVRFEPITAAVEGDNVLFTVVVKIELSLPCLSCPHYWLLQSCTSCCKQAI